MSAVARPKEVGVTETWYARVTADAEFRGWVKMDGRNWLAACARSCGLMLPIDHREGHKKFDHSSAKRLVELPWSSGHLCSIAEMRDACTAAMGEHTGEVVLYGEPFDPALVRQFLEPAPAGCMASVVHVQLWGPDGALVSGPILLLEGGLPGDDWRAFIVGRHGGVQSARSPRFPAPC